MIVALNTGLRLGELLGLSWERVDLSRGVIRLEMTKSGRRRGVLMNDASYQALVALGPKASGRVFKTRFPGTETQRPTERPADEALAVRLARDERPDSRSRLPGASAFSAAFIVYV